MYVIMITFLHDMIVLTLNNLSEESSLQYMKWITRQDGPKAASIVKTVTFKSEILKNFHNRQWDPTYLLFADLRKTNLRQFFTVSQNANSCQNSEEYFIFHTWLKGPFKHNAGNVSNNVSVSV